MKDPKKPGRKTDDPADAQDDIRKLFRGLEDVDPSPGDGEDEEVLELDDVVDDGEEGLKDLPDLSDDLADLGDFEADEGSLEEPEAEESLFDDDMTVELAPPGKPDERPREPLEEAFSADDSAREDDVGIPGEEIPMEDVGDAPEPEPAVRDGMDTEILRDVSPAEEAGSGDLTEPEPVETEVWDVDMELQELLKTAGADSAVEPEADTGEILPEAGPPPTQERPLEPDVPRAERVGFEASAAGREARVTEPDVSGADVAVLGTAAGGAFAAAAALEPETEDVRPVTSTEYAEEATMEERPAMFQPIVEALEKRLQARVQTLVQKAVQEQLPGIVRRVLQEEIERLSKSLG